MQPLFHAVQHGVKAGHVEEAYNDIFIRRINRGSDACLYRILGAIGPLLAISANFFEQPWRTPHRDLNAYSQTWLLSAAAFALTALGRLSDSIEPWQAALEADLATQDWRNAAIVGGELARTLLTLGRVADTIAQATQAVSHADRSNDQALREYYRCDLAQALTAAGDLKRADALFTEAVKIRAADRPASPQLLSVRAYQYSDLIFARGDAQQVLARGLYLLDVSERYLGKGMGLINIGYAHLLIGGAKDALNEPEAAVSLDSAVAGFRKAARTDELPKALLARAAHRRRRAAAGETDLIEGIRADLAEVEDIAGEEMRLYLTDLALERARLALDVPAAFASPEAARAEAQAQTAKAAALIADTGYHRRDGELAELQRRLAAA